MTNDALIMVCCLRHLWLIGNICQGFGLVNTFGELIHELSYKSIISISGQKHPSGRLYTLECYVYIYIYTYMYVHT